MRGDPTRRGRRCGGAHWPWLAVVALVVAAAVVGLGLVATDPAVVGPGPGAAVPSAP
ncbi:hypothetical protein [Saccharomonospora cyanea]|uniref:Uncharacterized protein n=1 Tax=Saccharomonospora cyanea NA-134 TaxID=882082 RepID=H5XEI5_9PSEU|nr:hypothetical protein [Saccharomonospora cyanea]EHR62464.1 hypothetical protein SaccyDRAFT_3637 [Saccharomonospora cyanea NA-134]